MDITHVIGTSGGAIIISVLALLTSVLFPLYLERRREKREEAKAELTAVQESWKRLAAATTDLTSQSFSGSSEGVEHLQQWVNAMFIEAASPGGCLWQSIPVMETLNKLQSDLQQHRSFLELGTADEPDTEAASFRLRDSATEAFVRIYQIAGQRLTEVEKKP